MTATAFICNMEDSVGSRKISEDSHKLKNQVYANTRLKVLAAVLMLLVVGLSGCITWIIVSRQELKILPELPQDCPHRFSATASFIGIKANFTAPRKGTYLIHGTIFKKEGQAKGICQESLLLAAKMLNTEKIITTENFCEDKVQFVVTAELEKDAGLSLELNCNNMEINETTSVLNVYGQNF